MNPEEIKSQQRGDGSDTPVTSKTAIESTEKANIDEWSLEKKLLYIQLKMGKLVKDQVNPHFKSTYADLNQTIDIVKDYLDKLKILTHQPVKVEDGKNVLHLTFNGESYSQMVIPEYPNPQHMGSALTYYRRYQLQSFFLMRTEDNDGNIEEHIIQTQQTNIRR